MMLCKMSTRRSNSSLVMVFLAASLLTTPSLEVQGRSADQDSHLLLEAPTDAGVTQDAKGKKPQEKEEVAMTVSDLLETETLNETELDEGASEMPADEALDLKPTTEDLGDVNPTTEDLDDVNPTTDLDDVNPTTDLDDVNPTTEDLDGVNPTTEAVDGVIPSDEALDDVNPATEALNVVTSPDEALDDVIPLDEVVIPPDEALDDIIPPDVALDVVIPPDKVLADVIPTHTRLEDMVPTDEEVREVTWTAEALLNDSGAEMDGGTSSTPDRQHKLVRNDDSFAASLLMDIRDVLYKERDGQQEEVERLNDIVGQRLGALTAETEDSIGRISNNFERLRHNMDEKVGLVLETFSTLKLLVLNQGDHLRALQQRLQRVETQAHDVEVQAYGFRRSLDEVKSTLASYRTHTGGSSHFTRTGLMEDDVPDPQVNTTKFGEKIQDMGPSLDDLTSQMEEMTEAVKSIKDELQVVQTNVTNLPPDSPSGHQPPKHIPTPVGNPPPCLCPTDQLRRSITKLEEAQQQQKTELDELARNLTWSDVSQQASQGSWLFSQRLGVVEGSLTDLRDVKRQINTVQEDILLLKEKVGKPATEVHTFTNLTTTTTTTTDNYDDKAGICVWPYKRGGGGCFHVHTDDRLNWQAAREHCRTLQGDLAAPHHYAHFKLFILKQRLSRAYTYWLGASDAGLEGEWTWTDGRRVNPDIWETSQPDSRSAKCMALKPVYKFVASAEACRESRFFICQQERQL